jgi:hypothetical protein
LSFSAPTLVMGIVAMRISGRGLSVFDFIKK